MEALRFSENQANRMLWKGREPGACNNTVHNPIIRRKMQTGTAGNQKFNFVLCKIQPDLQLQ